MPTHDSHWEMNGKTEAQKGEGICHLDLGCTGPRLARESLSDDEASQCNSLVGISVLQTPKVNWGRPASHTRKMLEPGHTAWVTYWSPGPGLAQGGPHGHWAAMSPSSTTLPLLILKPPPPERLR